MADKVKGIVLAAHAPWRPTGYGSTTYHLASILHSATGANVSIMAVDWADRPGVTHYHGVRVYLPHDRFGQEAIRSVVNLERPDLIISHFDPWVLGPEGYGASYNGGALWWPIVPVDQWPLVPWTRESVSKANRLLALSDYSRGKLTGLGFPVTRVGLPVDMDIFTPDGPSERERFDLSDDVLVVGMVASNVKGDRKALAEQILGFSRFADNVGRDNVRLLLNVPLGGYIENLGHLLDVHGVTPITSVLTDHARNYLFADGRMHAAFYRSCDVLLHASAAEGLGLCIIEALACGVPVIANNTTSMPELVDDNNGYLVVDQWSQWSPYGGYWQRPTAKGVAIALEQFYDEYKGGHQPSKDACRESVSDYSHESQWEQWRDLLT